MHPMDETDLSHTANLPYPLIGSKEEGLVFENRPAHRRAELVHAERRSVAPSNGLRVSTADRKSTRLNSSHVEISYAVFCLKKKKKTEIDKHNHKKNNKYITNK